MNPCPTLQAVACTFSFIVFSIILSGCTEITPIEKEIEQGILKGDGYSKNNLTSHRYLGIPYAQPPVAESRFRPPQPPKPFEKGRYDANQYSSPCPQKLAAHENFKLIGEEDCLYLNIWTPADSQPGDDCSHRFRHILATARSLPKKATVEQTKPIAKKTVAGMSPP